MIDVRNLSYRYPGAEQLALDQITLEIPSAAFALVVGPSGCGKSTLVRCINGLVPHFSGGQVAGEIRVNGRDPIALGPQGMSDLVGCVFQDPEAQAVMDRVEDEIAFALEYGGMNRQDMRIRVEETLDLLDLALLRTRKLDTLSGGERQRVAIAAALALRPHILILDEPTSQLDPQSAEDVLQALVRLNSDLGLTIVLVEHRLERVLPFVDQIIALSSEGSVQVGTPDTVLPHLTQVPPLVALGKALGWSPLPLTIKAGLRFSRGYAVPSAIPPVSSGASSKPLLQMLHVDAGYDGHLAVRDVSLGIASGEIVALLGRNGAGKSTILRCLVGLLCPIRGRVLLDGVDIAGRDVASICQRVGYLPQDPNALLFADTVREEVLITLRNHGIQDVSRADALLAQLGLADKAKAYPRDLSVGERQRVALAVISVPRPKVLLLDEPTRGLDSAAKQMLADLLHTWRTQSMAICVVTHDVEFVALLANRVIILGRGEIIADGSTISVLGNSPLFAPQIARLFPTTNWLTLRDAFNALL